MPTWHSTQIRCDNAKSEDSEAVKELHREFIIKDQFSEPYHQQQNLVKGGAIKLLKSHAKVLMDQTNTPDNLWFLYYQHIVHVHNHCACPSNN